MTKIYLIKHLDSGMKYVGITDGDLAKRWLSHMIDKKSAVYEALRSEGYRMTMELLEEVPSRDEALRKEQDYIRTLGTAQPHGWNRMVSKVEVVKPVVKTQSKAKNEDISNTAFMYLLKSAITYQQPELVKLLLFTPWNASQYAKELWAMYKAKKGAE